MIDTQRISLQSLLPLLPLQCSRSKFWTTLFRYSFIGLEVLQSLLLSSFDILHNSLGCPHHSDLHLSLLLFVRWRYIWMQLVARHCEWRRLLCVSPKSTERRIFKMSMTYGLGWSLHGVFGGFFPLSFPTFSSGGVLDWLSMVFFLPWIEPIVSYPLCFSLSFSCMSWAYQDSSYGGIRNQGQFVFFLTTCILWSGCHGVDWFLNPSVIIQWERVI
jgi:hypothetical protein